MNYKEYKQKATKAVNEFPMIFAFSNEQLKDGLDRMGWQKEDVCQIPSGAIILKTAKKDYMQLWIDLELELQQLMKDDQFAIGAIEYELCNHEYCITFDPSEVVSLLSVDLDNERENKIFMTARSNYLKRAEEGDWW